MLLFLLDVEVIDFSCDVGTASERLSSWLVGEGGGSVVLLCVLLMAECCAWYAKQIITQKAKTKPAIAA